MKLDNTEYMEVRAITPDIDNHTIIVECDCKRESKPFSRKPYKYEKFADGVITDGFKESKNFRVLKNHDKNDVLGTKANSKVVETATGFRLECRLANTEANRDLLAMMETMPDLISCSFGFKARKDEVKNRVREVQAIELVEVSVLVNVESQYSSHLVDIREMEQEDEQLKADLLKIYQEMYGIE